MLFFPYFTFFLFFSVMISIQHETIDSSFCINILTLNSLSLSQFSQNQSHKIYCIFALERFDCKIFNLQTM